MIGGGILFWLCDGKTPDWEEEARKIAWIDELAHQPAPLEPVPQVPERTVVVLKIHALDPFIARTVDKLSMVHPRFAVVVLCDMDRLSRELGNSVPRRSRQNGWLGTRVRESQMTCACVRLTTSTEVVHRNHKDRRGASWQPRRTPNGNKLTLLPKEPEQASSTILSKS